MEEIQLGLRLPRVDQHQLGPWLKSWQLGQVFQGQVLDKSPSGALLLRISGHQITAFADLPVPKGALLRLEVTGLHPAPSLKIIAPLTGNTMAINPVDRQLQVLLPRQGSVLAPFLAFLDPTLNVKLLSLLGVKHGAPDRHFEHFSQLPLPVDPKALQRAILQSGVFLESDLARLVLSGGTWAQRDLKALLFRLLSRTNQAVARSRQIASDKSALELLVKFQGELEGALATITLNQLSTRQTDESEPYTWLFDMPFRVRDSLHGLSISVRRERGAVGEDSDQPEWRILLAVNLPRLGHIVAEIFLRGNRVSVVLYSERTSTARSLDRQLSQLRASLEGQQFDVSVLRSMFRRRTDKNKADWPICLDEKV